MISAIGKQSGADGKDTQERNCSDRKNKKIVGNTRTP